MTTTVNRDDLSRMNATLRRARGTRHQGAIYPTEMKLETARLAQTWIENSKLPIEKIAKSLGIHRDTLKCWIRDFLPMGPDGKRANMGNDRRPQAAPAPAAPGTVPVTHRVEKLPMESIPGVGSPTQARLALAIAQALTSGKGVFTTKVGFLFNGVEVCAIDVSADQACALVINSCKR